MNSQRLLIVLKYVRRYFKIEGTLDVSNLQENTILVDVEEEGVTDLKKYLDKFQDAYVTINIQNKVEEEIVD